MNNFMRKGLNTDNVNHFYTDSVKHFYTDGVYELNP